MTTAMIETDLPGPARAGETGTWALPRDGESTLTVEARFLGVGSSRRGRHSDDHLPGRFVADGGRCSACRWSEPRIFRFHGQLVLDDGSQIRDGYVVLHTGRSVVPGEVSRHRLEVLRGSLEVIETLVTRRRGEAYLSVAAGQVLAMSAQYDEDLAAAYLDRAVV